MSLPQSITTESMLDAFSTAVIFVDTDFQIMHVNAACELLLGVSRLKAISHNLYEALPCCLSIKKLIQMAIATQYVLSERNLPITLRQDQKITIDCVITPCYEDDMQTNYIIIELSQVDRRIRISREDHLLTQNEGTRDLLRGVAHEIKNPLGGIRGAAQLLSAEIDNEEYSEYTEVITREVDRLQNLVDRMLGPRQLPNIQKTNIHEPLEDVRRLISAEASDAISITADYDPSLPEVSVDRDMLQQALLNLARNSMQAVSASSDPRIMFRSRSERQFTIGHTRHRLVLKIEIIDNGGGIPEEMQETIFLPMVTSKPDGTGLGLPIAQTLIQRHGGLIEYENTDDKTCFIVYLPVENTNDIV